MKVDRSVEHGIEKELEREHDSAQARASEVRELREAAGKAEELVSKAQRDVQQSQAESRAVQEQCKELQAALESVRAELAQERSSSREHMQLKLMLEQELGETKAERKKWEEKQAVLERAHVKDMMQLKEEQSQLREDGIDSLRQVCCDVGFRAQGLRRGQRPTVV